ncbi:MAG: sensor histidine kinase [Leadbetterella sp.]
MNYKLYVILFLFLRPHVLISQDLTLSNIYKTDNGLISNHTYETVEDKDGMLWISSNKGVSCFDGKRFINYTSRDGLPSNDVIQIRKEKNGTIWANCYLDVPAYFDKMQNRFVKIEVGDKIQDFKNNISFFQIHPEEGMLLINKRFTYFIKNKKIYAQHSPFVVFINEKQFYSFDYKKMDHFTFKNSELNKTETVFFSKTKNIFYNLFIVNNKIFKLGKHKLESLNILSLFPYKGTKQGFETNEIIKWYKVNKDDLYITTQSDIIYVLDIHTLKQKSKFKFNLNVNSITKDSQGNLWITTAGDGLVKHSTFPIKKHNLPKEMNENLFSIALGNNNEINSGNYQGEYYHKGTIQKIVPNSKLVFNNWVKNFHQFGNKKVIVSDKGYSIIENNQLKFYDFWSNRNSVKWDDSTLLIAKFEGVSFLNIYTHKSTTFTTEFPRSQQVYKINNDQFYFLKNEGIFKYTLSTRTQKKIVSNGDLKNQTKLIGFSVSKNNQIWCHSDKGHIYRISNEKTIEQIKTNEQFPLIINKLKEIDSYLWVATNEGLLKCDISRLPDMKTYTITQSDGLNSNAIQDFDNSKDSLYVASDKGINILPLSFFPKSNTIKPKLVSLKINNTPTTIQNEYFLNSDQKNILLDIAAIDLSGHFNHFIYSINNSSSWNVAQGNLLNVILQGGNNTLKIKAIDNNNNSSHEQLTLKFDIKIPLYERIYFWVLITIVGITGLGLIFYWNHLKRIKRKEAQKNELIKQRNMITADLHDDIGSTLSSLRLNSAVANKLLSKSPDQVQSILSKIENQAQQLGENLSDMVWSLKPIEEEFIDFDARIKNFTNDILGSMGIDYEIKIDEGLSQNLLNINLRKNLLFVTKEAINNAAKYSQATKIEIYCSLKENDILLTVKDNGRGFIPENIVGNGIKNMQKRIKELNGQFEVQSQIGNGTTLSATFPLIP